MGLYVLDIVFGVLFMISISFSVAGLIIYRYRRDAGPVFLAFSGLPGVLASVLFILDSSKVLDIPVWIPISGFVLLMVLILIAVVKWRGGE